MAAKQPSVSVRLDESADTYQLGFTLEGTFVPVAQVSAGYARALAAGSDAGESSDDDDTKDEA